MESTILFVLSFSLGNNNLPYKEPTFKVCEAVSKISTPNSISSSNYIILEDYKCEKLIKTN